eukprot:COSAG06_NODE_32391_length_507_cov_0.622549_2_plen_33_part_01
MDSDGNGEVDFEEFVAWWTGQHGSGGGHDDSSG